MRGSSSTLVAPGRPEQIAQRMPLAVLALIAGPGLTGTVGTAVASGAGGCASSARG